VPNPPMTMSRLAAVTPGHAGFARGRSSAPRSATTNKQEAPDLARQRTEESLSGADQHGAACGGQ
jgi:hypothetical protein